MDIWERIRYARDQALKGEEIERQRLADADTAELQQAASVRLAARQAVREALDDVLDEHSEPTKGNAIGAAAGGEGPDADEQEDGTTGNDAGDDEIPLTGTTTSADEAEPSYAGAGTPDDGDVQDDPGSQVAG
jgi:membrane protein involved in colicin uptake